MERHISVEPFPPGEYLHGFLEDKGWTQDDLASVLGRSRQHVHRLLQGKTAITPDTAHELADAFGTSAELWMNLQVSYELSLAARKERDIKRRAQIFSKAPVKELIRRGWIEDSKSTETLETSVCGFLGTRSIDEEPVAPPVAARKGTEYGTETAAQIAWYRRARVLAEHAPATTYDKSNLVEGIADLRKLAAYAEDARCVPKVLADIGIRLALVEHLKGTKIDGVAFWLDESTPAIALSLRYDRIDNLWHTLLHEIIHISREDMHPAIDSDMMSDGLPEDERQVNELAAEALIPQDKLRSFISRVRPYYYQKRVVQFAQRHNVHPGIVVGQLQYRRELKYEQLRKLLPKVRGDIIPSAVVDGWGNAPSF